MNIFELQEALIKTTKILAGRNLPVYLEGFQPRVEYNTVTKEPERIFLPVVPEGTPPKLLDAIQGFIDHECSHIKFSASEDICDTTKNKLWHYIHNCIEDPRVNKAMGNHYVGSKKNIRRAYDFLFNEVREGQPNPYSKEYVESIDRSNPEALAQFHLQYAPLWFGGKMGCNLSREKFHELKLDNYYEELIDKADPEMVRALDKISTPLDVVELSDYWTSFFSEEVLEKMKPDTADGDKLTDGEVDKLMENTDDLEDRLAKAIKDKILEGVFESKEHIWWTDRFDKKIHKQDIVKEAKHGLGAIPSIVKFEDETKTVTNYLAKDLRRLLEEQRRRYYISGYKSGKLNSKSLFSVRCGNDRIFKKKNNIRDVNAAVSLLIDMSGSMGGSKIYTAMQSAYAFAMTLQQLKVPFEVYGFVTEGTNRAMLDEYNKLFGKDHALAEKVVNPGSPERFYAFKEFGENFDIISKQAMSGASKGGCFMSQNEDSKHVMFAARRLSVRPEKVKALFVFSDGQPSFAYGRDRSSAEQLKFVINNAKRKYGVDVYGIGIASECVSKFYNQYKVVQVLNELSTALFDFLRKIF